MAFSPSAAIEAFDDVCSSECYSTDLLSKWHSRSRFQQSECMDASTGDDVHCLWATSASKADDVVYEKRSGENGFREGGCWNAES